jgi:hypothetical protein
LALISNPSETIGFHLKYVRLGEKTSHRKALRAEMIGRGIPLPSFLEIVANGVVEVAGPCSKLWQKR